MNRTHKLGTWIRPLVARLPLPLCLVAGVLAAAPWLRSFPASLAAAPLYGAAVLSALIPVVTVRFWPRWLWPALLVDLAAFVLFTLLVVLHDITDLDGLVRGLYHGPSQVLTFALPLVSPRSLLVAPVALTWLAGAVAGECMARRWSTALPHLAYLVAFGLAFAGTQRATAADPSGARLRETLLGAGLLATLLLLRAAQAWLRQDESAEATQADAVLPLRALATGTALAVVVAVGAAFAVQADAFPKRAAAPQRVPSVDRSQPLSPLAFVAGLRASDTAKPVFTVEVDRAVPGYIALANVDSYDGAGWTFDRTFRPSGGTLPADPDPTIGTGRAVRQYYRLADGPLVGAPWMPFVYRPQQVTGTSVNIDPASGMVVPAHALRAGTTYQMRSNTAGTTFADLHASRVTADSAVAATDTQLPGTLRSTLARAVKVFSAETGVSPAQPLPFLQALQRDLRSNYALTGRAQQRTSPSAAASTSPSSRRPPDGRRAGSAGFADVLASILGSGRAGSPEQYATLVALIARQLGVPARVVTGFRVGTGRDAGQLRPGQHQITTAEAWTWAEVPIVGHGWTVLDAAPARYAAPSKPSDSATASSTPSATAVPTQQVVISPGRGGHAVGRHSAIPHPRTAHTDVLLIALAVVGALILAILIALALRKPVRAARRRRRPDPSRRLIGAWQESLDVLTEAGLPDLSALTSAEVAALARDEFGAVPGARVESLGRSANAVVYASTTVVTDAAADDAWSTQRAIRTGVRRQLGVRRRAGSVLRYHRSARRH